MTYGAGGFAIWQGAERDPYGGGEPANFFVIFFGAIFILALWPLSFWWVYYKHMRSVDRKKALAFLAASYGAVAVGVHTARVHSERTIPAEFGVPDGRGHMRYPTR